MGLSTITQFGKMERAEFWKIAEFFRTAAEESGCSKDIQRCFVLFQSYPYEFSQELVDDLLRKHPLIPILLVAGAGCEGEVRTGKPLQGVFRCYASEWDASYENEFRKLLTEKKSLFSLPKTAGNDEIAVYWANVR